MNRLGKEKDERTKDDKIKDIRNPFRLKKEFKETDDTTIKYIRNLLGSKIKNKAKTDRGKDILIKEFSNLNEREEEYNITNQKE